MGKPKSTKIPYPLKEEHVEILLFSLVVLGALVGVFSIGVGLVLLFGQAHRPQIEAPPTKTEVKELKVEPRQESKAQMGPLSKEEKVFDVPGSSPDQIREFVHTEAGQDEIVSFVQSIRDEVGNRQGWEATCVEAEEAAKAFGPDTLSALLALLEPYIYQTPPGHDPNHKYRDMLSALALVNADPYVASARFRSDVVAGLVAGSFHDIGTSIVARYQDTQWKVAHAEAGGWLVYQLAREILGEAGAKLSCYGVLTHTHYLKPMDIKLPEGVFTRQVYWDETWVEDGKPVGLAYRITRFADRLDTNGASTHFPRHLLAQADASEEGGMDLTGDQFFEIKGENILRLLKPAVFGGSGKDDPPTTLKHILNYAGSNFARSAYSLYDGNYPVMVDLLLSKVFTTRELVRIVTQAAPEPSFSEVRTRALMKSVLRQISGSPFFERAWRLLRDKSWFALSAEEQARWQAGFEYVQKAYLDWLMEVASYAFRNEAYKPLVAELVERCL